MNIHVNGDKYELQDKQQSQPQQQRRPEQRPPPRERPDQPGSTRTPVLPPHFNPKTLLQAIKGLIQLHKVLVEAGVLPAEDIEMILFPSTEQTQGDEDDQMQKSPESEPPRGSQGTQDTEPEREDPPKFTRDDRKLEVLKKLLAELTKS